MEEETWLGDFLALSETERAAVLAELDDEALALVAEDVGLRRPVSLREHLEQVDPGPHLDWWHVGAMIDACQTLLDGDIERLLLCAPPRTFKSRIVSQGVPSCRIRNEPRSKIMLACALDELVQYHSRHGRDAAIRAGVKLRQDSRSVSLWETEEGGTYKATTILGGQLGFGWDLLGVDDPFPSVDAARSAVTRQRTWDRWKDDLQSRAQDRPEGGPPVQFLMHQRVHDDDVAGRLAAWLEAMTEMKWHALILAGYSEAQPYLLPRCVHRIEDPRKRPGEPLCADPGVMREIDERRTLNVRLHRIIDQQRPPKMAGGGVFPARLPIIGEGRDDLGDPVAAILNMAAEGLIAQPKRWIRGQDPAAGGADALASALLCVLEPGQGIEFVWCDMTEGHPALGLVESTVLANARRQTPESGVEQAIPKGAGEGMLFANRIQRLLRDLGYVVHVMPVQRGKVALANHHANAATPSCRSCGAIVVDRDEAGRVEGSDVCRCAVPDLVPGRVAVLAGPLAEKFVRVHADFSGDAGDDDHLVDAAACAFNANGFGRRTLGPPRIAD